LINYILHITAEENIALISISNTLGQLVQQVQLSGEQKKYALDIYKLEVGNYIVKVLSKNGKNKCVLS